MKKFLLCNFIIMIFVTVNCTILQKKHNVLAHKNTLSTSQKILAWWAKKEEKEEMEKLVKYDKEDILWLARNIFFEARSEGIHGRMVIANVTINRTLDRRWPNTIKEVVQQPWQFSWFNEGVVPPIAQEEQEVFEECYELAKFCLDLYDDMAKNSDFKVDGIAHGADHYFADYIKMPSWAKKMTYLGKVGRHLLYKG